MKIKNKKTVNDRPWPVGREVGADVSLTSSCRPVLSTCFLSH